MSEQATQDSGPRLDLPVGTSSREPCGKPEHPRCLSGSSQKHPPAHLQVRPACPFYHRGQPCPALTGTPSPWEHSCLGQDGLQAEHQGLTSPEPGGLPPDLSITQGSNLAPQSPLRLHITRYDGELREPLVWRQGSQGFMSVAENKLVIFYTNLSSKE